MTDKDTLIREPTGIACSKSGCRSMSQQEISGLLESIRIRDAKRAADMPTEKDALNTLFEAYQRLKELGWSDAIYCPKDGSLFDAIEVGSTGIFDCYYEGAWPKGTWWIPENGDTWPSRPILWKAKAAGYGG